MYIINTQENVTIIYSTDNGNYINKNHTN